MADLAGRILHDIENTGPGGVELNYKKVTYLGRSACNKIEAKARQKFVDTGAPLHRQMAQTQQMGRSRSMPGGSMRPGSGVRPGSGDIGNRNGHYPGSANRTSSGPRSIHFLQKGFGVGERPEIHKIAKDTLAPGQYETHTIGTILFQAEGSESAVSHPGQQCLSHFKTSRSCSFGRPKEYVGLSKPPRLSAAPGPGHYNAINYWDPCWQKYPAMGTSLARKVPPPGESRFGSLARGSAGGSKVEDDFLRS